MDEFPELILSILSGVFSGVVVSLITLWLAERKRSEHERRTEARRRETVLAAIGRELQWNRTATRRLDADNSHYMIGKLMTVAFERHGSELAMIAPGSIEAVFRHYAMVSVVRAGLNAVIAMSGRAADKSLRMQWMELSDQARVEVSNTATQALKNLGLSVEP